MSREQVVLKTQTQGPTRWREEWIGIADSRRVRYRSLLPDEVIGEGEKYSHSYSSVCPASVHVDYVVRVFDIIISLLISLCAFPLVVLSALLIKLSSAGPVFYQQHRVGKDGKVFTIYKFRTMVDGAEKRLGPVWALRGDDRVTPVGRILRSSRIDELPQLYNVLRGDMSLVGPRPERPYFVKRHPVLQGARMTVKPGLTGLAQIRGSYDLKPSQKAKYDRLYIRKRSVLLNAYILSRTIPVLLKRKGW